MRFSAPKVGGKIEAELAHACKVGGEKMRLVFAIDGAQRVARASKDAPLPALAAPEAARKKVGQAMRGKRRGLSARLRPPPPRSSADGPPRGAGQLGHAGAPAGRMSSSTAQRLVGAINLASSRSICRADA